MVEADRPIKDVTSARLGEVESALQEALLVERERSAFLAEASRALAGSLNIRRTIPRVLGIAVPRMGTGGQVAMLSGRSLRLTACNGSGRAPQEAVLLRNPTDREGLGRVLVTGRAALVEATTPTEARAWLPDAELAQIVAPDYPVTIASVPLTARGTIFGVLSVARPVEEGRYDERELSLLEDLGERAALALDAARLYTERSHVASVLQASLRPPTLPELDGVLLAARYRPAFESSEVGGDFYDVHGSGDDWSLVMGDVMGKGVEAAVLTGQARQTVRTACLIDRDPARVLDLLNATLLSTAGAREATQFATVAVVRLRPAAADPALGASPGGLLLDVADAGHPLPLVLRRDGSIEAVGEHGMLVGVFPQARYRTTSTVLCPGDVCLLYTDGVTEARGPRGELGVDGLRALLPAFAGSEPAALVEHLEQAVMQHLDGAPHDDIALLAIGAPAGHTDPARHTSRDQT
ncbi:MAG: PP2C family protein-serine/threonine phosphatase [Actinomycetales bacterium]